MMMSEPLMSMVWSNLCSGGVPLILSLVHTKVSVSRTLMSFRYHCCNVDPILFLAFLISSVTKLKPPWTTRLEPIRIEQWPFLGEGAGPEVAGWDHAIISRSSTKMSLKNSWPFQPPNTNNFVPPTKFAVWSNLELGAPPPSGPWNQVIVTGSRACRSRYTVPLGPFPPNTIILDPANTAEWP